MNVAVAVVFDLFSMPALAQTSLVNRPLVEEAPVVGRGDYTWLLPIVLILIAAAGWYIWRRRNAGL